MKRKRVQRLIIAATTIATVASQFSPMYVFAGEEDDSPYEIIKDENGNPIDLGGIEIIQRDWWTDPDNYFMTNPYTQYDEERKEYIEWAEKTYNFTFKQTCMSDWGSTPSDYVEYVEAGGDDNNYLWVMRDDSATSTAMVDGLMYDLADLDCLNFNDKMFTNNKVHERYTFKGGVYAMQAGIAQPGECLYMNEDLLKNSGVNVDDIYDAQKNGTWDWAMFKDIMDKVQKDSNGDGINETWGVTGNVSSWAYNFAYVNGGRLIGNSPDGYTVDIKNPKSLEGIKFGLELLNDYYMPRPSGASWDYYREEFPSGSVAFLTEGFWYANQLEEVGFKTGMVTLPKGPSGSLVNSWTNLAVVIPSCYDADRAWKIAMAFVLYNQPVKGFEDYNEYLSYANRPDMNDRVRTETIPLMCKPESGIATYDYMVPEISIGPDFAWGVYAGCDLDAVINKAYDKWIEDVKVVNQKGVKKNHANTQKDNPYEEYGLSVTYVPEDYEDNSGSPMIIEGKDLSWNDSNEKSYWYEGGVKQGTYYDPKGVLGTDPETGAVTNRGREICDNSILDENGNGVWFWLDSCYDGAKAIGKEVWVPYIYQNEADWDDATLRNIANESDKGMEDLVYNFMKEKKGKWVRYDEKGGMLKGWVVIEGALADKYPNQSGNTYYYDTRTGLMAKGKITIDGVEHFFDENSGVLQW